MIIWSSRAIISTYLVSGDPSVRATSIISPSPRTLMLNESYTISDTVHQPNKGIVLRGWRGDHRPPRSISSVCSRNASHRAESSVCALTRSCPITSRSHANFAPRCCCPRHAHAHVDMCTPVLVCPQGITRVYTRKRYRYGHRYPGAYACD